MNKKITVKELVYLIDRYRESDERIQIIRYGEDFDCYDEVGTNSNYLDLIGNLEVISISAIDEDTFRIDVNWKNYMSDKDRLRKIEIAFEKSCEFIAMHRQVKDGFHPDQIKEMFLKDE